MKRHTLDRYTPSVEETPGRLITLRSPVGRRREGGGFEYGFLIGSAGFWLKVSRGWGRTGPDRVRSWVSIFCLNLRIKKRRGKNLTKPPTVAKTVFMLGGGGNVGSIKGQ